MDGTCPLLREGGAALLPASCPGQLGSQVAKGAELSLVAALPIC